MGDSTDAKYFINWNETCYLPPDYLITEESFNAHTNDSSYAEYSLLSEIQQMECKREKTLPKSDSHIELPESLKFMPKVQTRYQYTNPQPRGSGISNQQRKFYFWYTKQLEQNRTPKEDNTFKFKQLMQRVVEEQSDYQNFLRNCAHSNVNEYIFLRNDVREFFLNSHLKSMMDVLEESQENYSLFQTIQMQPALNTIITFQHKKTVCTQKSIPSLHQLPLHVSLNFKLDPFQKQEVVSMETIESVCKQEDVHIYMSSSAVVSIMETFVDLSHEFIMPLSIKTVTRENNQKENLLMFHNPFPRRQMSSRDVNSNFYANSLKRMLWKSTSTAATFDHKTSCPPIRTFNKFQCGSKTMLIDGQIDCATPSEQTYKLFTKVEYQPSIGFEQISLVDYCRAWWSSLCCNASCILFVRLDPRNDCIVRVDSYPRDVLCAPGCPYQPQHYFHYLEQLLTRLLTLNVTGEFFLEHASGNNQFFLFQKKEQGITTLATKYKDFITKKREVISEVIFPWLPIDTNILLPDLQGIPWLFDLQTTRNSNPRRGGRSKHRGRKKKGTVASSPAEESEHTPQYIRLGKPVVRYGKSDELDLF